jgi:hypothetical protein
MPFGTALASGLLILIELFSFFEGGCSVSQAVLEAPRVKKSKRGREYSQRLDGYAEKVQNTGRFLQLRFGKDPGDYLILFVPKACRIHRSGESLPLQDVQFCDSVSVSYHRHYRFDVQLAQEIELI